MTLDTLFDLRKHLKIKHHSPGRLRLKVGMSVLKDPAFAELPSFEETPPGVKQLKMSLLSRTVTLDYDRKMLPPELLEELIVTEDINRGRAILADLEQRIGVKLL
jgi:hypothetical protein